MQLVCAASGECSHRLLQQGNLIAAEPLCKKTTLLVYMAWANELARSMPKVIIVKWGGVWNRIASKLQTFSLWAATSFGHIPRSTSCREAGVSQLD